MTQEEDAGSPARRDPGQPRREYASYTVRIWSQPGSARYDRAEVHHLQTGKVEAARSVTSEWVRQVIDRCQHREDAARTGEPH